MHYVTPLLPKVIICYISNALPTTLNIAKRHMHSNAYNLLSLPVLYSNALVKKHFNIVKSCFKPISYCEAGT